MYKLLFPVKLGPLIFIVLSGLGSCGYAPAYQAATKERERFSVTAAPHKVPQMDVVQMVLAGVRAELSRAGAARPGAGYPRVVVEVLRVDERSSGIAAVRPNPAAGPVPMARGSTIAVLARAWIERAAGSSERDTGDMSRVENYGADADTELEVVNHDQALRSAARRLGHALGRRILFEPEPNTDPM